MLRKNQTRSLQDMYSINGFLNEAQREHFCGEIMKILGSERSIEEDLDDCLNQVWKKFDMGGHSWRDIRGLLLDAVQYFRKTKQHERAKECLRILIAMYHDVDYMNKMHWMDITIESPLDTMRVHILYSLVLAGMILDIDELPNPNKLPHDEILEMCRKN